MIWFLELEFYLKGFAGKSYSKFERTLKAFVNGRITAAIMPWATMADKQSASLYIAVTKEFPWITLTEYFCDFLHSIQIWYCLVCLWGKI